MTTSSKRMREKAASMLPPATDNIRDIDRELIAIAQELELLTEKKDDVKWAGNVEKANTVNYQIMLKRTIRAMLIKRRKQTGKQTGKQNGG